MNRTLAEIAKLTSSTLIGDPNHRITGVEELQLAGQQQLSFLDNLRYKRQLLGSKAGAVFLHPKHLPEDHKGNFLLHEKPSLAFQIAMELYILPAESGFAGIHPTCVIHPTAKLHPSVTMGPCCVIDRDVMIGKNTRLGPHVTIGPETVIGEESTLYAHVTIRERCSIANRVIIQPGAIIGSCGFGYHTDEKGVHHNLKQLGRVVIEDDVGIGANTTIDRARFKETLIRRGTKIDNLVQIAHGVELGEDNMIVSQVGIAGSTKTGKSVVMGGQVGVAGHIEIAPYTVLTARCAVSKSLDQPGVYYGAPAMEDKEFKRHFLALRQVEKVVARFKELEKKFAHLIDDEV